MTTNPGMDLEGFEPLNTVYGSVNWCRLYENECEIDGSEVRNTYCSHGEFRFGSQHRHGAS